MVCTQMIVRMTTVGVLVKIAVHSRSFQGERAGPGQSDRPPIRGTPQASRQVDDQPLVKLAAILHYNELLPCILTWSLQMCKSTFVSLLFFSITLPKIATRLHS